MNGPANHSIVATCKNLRKLELGSLCGDGELLKSIEQLVSDLKDLESFTLHKFFWSHEGLRKFKISSSSLRELWLAFTDDPVDFQLDAPHVSEIFYLGWISSNLSLGTSPTKGANFVEWDDEEIMYDNLVEFLRTFNHIEVVKLDDFAPCDLTIPEYLRNSLDPPLWDIKHLTISARYCDDLQYIPVHLDMLESLLWMAPRLNTLSFAQFIADSCHKTTITYQFTHGNPEINMEEVPLISESQRDKLIEVKVRSFPGDAEGLELQKYYFYNNEKTLESKAKWLVVQLPMSKNGEGLPDYPLPRAVYAGQSLSRLVLKGLKLSLSGDAEIDLPSLRELHLICNEIDDEYLAQLIINSPLLEFLKIRNCFGFGAFEVLGSHHELKRIELVNSLSMYDRRYVNAPQEIETSCGQGSTESGVFRYLMKSIEDLGSNLKCLETFSMDQFTWSEEGIRRFKISSNSLRKLWLEFIEDPVYVELDAPQLSEIFYFGLMSSNLSFGTSPIKDANFVLWATGVVTSENLVEFLRAFNHIVVVKLGDFSSQYFEVPQHLRNSLDPPLWDVKHFKYRCLLLS
ncbi:OLC1v1015847C1 [Oldenlandia corymbosa var. corymbosa]|uniref:OLC1v1015847C1 n=1 Tax=Oldenlandia corymbosa var. corymbosa TaxID=529605 RepID=A0AAV1E6Z1_OLDCO|nr:OLC1v1015847C1 [Oldenlandia corymbosa var. corymbosa]